MLNLRKLIVTTRLGITLLFAVPFFIAMLFITGIHRPVVLIFNAAIGILFGLRASSKFRKNSQYFIANIQSNRYSTTKEYNKLFKQNKLPDSDEAQSDYGHYLDGLTKLHRRSNKREYVSLTILTALFILLLIIDHGFTLLNALFGLVLIFGLYSTVQSKKNLIKIEQLRNQIKLNQKARTK